ncbi:MAG: TRAP transporter small permease [Hyphomicrobiales bacterium]|nr:TRAP transporter small permease [Hyphomicrobiales bacterium]
MVKLIDMLELYFNRLVAFLIGLVAASIGLFAILIPVNLIMVKMQWGSLWWLNESAEYTLYFGVFIGAPWVLQQGAHVRVDVINALISQKSAIRLERLVDIIGFTLCVCLCIYGLRAMMMEWEDGTMPDKTVSIANWIILVFFAFSFFMLALEFLFRLRRAQAIVEDDGKLSTKAGF